MATRKKATNQPRTSVAKPPAEPSEKEVAAFLKLVMRGLGEDELKREAGKVCNAPLEQLVAAAEEKFLQAGQADPDVVRGFCLEAYRELYRIARDHGELSVALKCLAHLERAARS